MQDHSLKSPPCCCVGQNDLNLARRRRPRRGTSRASAQASIHYLRRKSFEVQRMLLLFLVTWVSIFIASPVNEIIFVGSTTWQQAPSSTLASSRRPGTANGQIILHHQFRGGGVVNNASNSDDQEQVLAVIADSPTTTSTPESAAGEFAGGEVVEASADAASEDLGTSGSSTTTNESVPLADLMAADLSSQHPRSSSPVEQGVESMAVSCDTQQQQQQQQKEEDKAIDAYIEQLLTSVEDDDSTVTSLPVSSATSDAYRTSCSSNITNVISQSSEPSNDASLSSQSGVVTAVTDENEEGNVIKIDSMYDEPSAIFESGSSNSSAVVAELDVTDSTMPASTVKSSTLPSPENSEELHDDDKEDDRKSSTLEDGASTTQLERSEVLSDPSLTIDKERTEISNEKAQSPKGHPPHQIYRRRVPPPNKLYRFLLRHRYWGGHVTAMVIVWLSEWTQIYVPFVAYIVQYYVWNKLFRDSTTTVRRRGRKYDDDSEYYDMGYYDARQKASGSTSSGWASTTTTLLKQQRRSGTSKKALKKLTQQADQVALHVLQRLTQQSKYKYVTTNFLQRHKLGPFGQSNAVPNVDKEVASALAVLEVDSTAAIDTDVGEEEEEDADWVIQALTVGGGDDEADEIVAMMEPSATDTLDVDGLKIQRLKSKRKKSSSKQKSQNKINLASVLQDSERSRSVSKLPSQRVSDRDAGVWGKLRAATSDSLGRSLLGAYPGDAVPISEAGNPKGVTELAKRYGYGDWSDDSDNGDGENDAPDEKPQRKGNKRPTKRRKRRGQQEQEQLQQHKRQEQELQQQLQKRKKIPTKRVKKKKGRSSSKLSGIFLGVEFDMSLGASSSTDLTRAKRRKAAPTWSPTKPTKKKSTTGSPATNSPFDSFGGSTTPRSTSNRTSRRFTEAQPIRHAMERTEETQCPITLPPSSERKRGAVVRPTMDRLSSLERRGSSILDNNEND